MIYVLSYSIQAFLLLDELLLEYHDWFSSDFRNYPVILYNVIRRWQFHSSENEEKCETEI